MVNETSIMSEVDHCPISKHQTTKWSGQWSDIKFFPEQEVNYFLPFAKLTRIAESSHNYNYIIWQCETTWGSFSWAHTFNKSNEQCNAASLLRLWMRIDVGEVSQIQTTRAIWTTPTIARCKRYTASGFRRALLCVLGIQWKEGIQKHIFRQSTPTNFYGC